MAVVVKWDGKTVPKELSALPKGRYIIEPLDVVAPLSPEEESGLEQALDALEAGESVDGEVVKADLEALFRR